MPILVFLILSQRPLSCVNFSLFFLSHLLGKIISIIPSSISSLLSSASKTFCRINLMTFSFHVIYLSTQNFYSVVLYNFYFSIDIFYLFCHYHHIFIRLFEHSLLYNLRMSIIINIFLIHLTFNLGKRFYCLTFSLNMEDIF